MILCFIGCMHLGSLSIVVAYQLDLESVVGRRLD